MERFEQVVLTFALFGVVGPLYCAGVHRLAAWCVRVAPLRFVKLLSLRLWRTHWDMARKVDRIGLHVEDRLRKRIPR